MSLVGEVGYQEPRAYKLPKITGSFHVLSQNLSPADRPEGFQALQLYQHTHVGMNRQGNQR